MDENKNISQSEYNRLYGDFDLTEENCTPETWAWLNAPDEEQELGFEQWQKLYMSRLSTGYYDRKKEEGND